MKLDILAFGAHPDDIELGVGGTIAKAIAEGKKVGVIDLTQGELGTRGTAETRETEASNAAKVLGLSARENLGFADGFFINNKAHQLEVIKMLRKYQPDIVLCNAIDDRHIDHGKGSKLVSDACFLSGLIKIETELDGNSQEKWRPKHVYHYIQWKNIEPDFVVDISNFIDIKQKAVDAYQTQFFNKESNEPETPITSKTFLESISYRARDLGRLVGVDYAEGFTVERYITVDSLFDLK
ncbi:MAG: bacillithiol biosynthesis deacetylase BshB1 [Lacinutrix sp.]|uniref:bacillithiol biosynthesis deacetylase BshB1 n=1 Tax=Lacinutrix sp. TaxID=1937692 RepID=UPI0030AAA389